MSLSMHCWLCTRSSHYQNIFFSSHCTYIRGLSVKFVVFCIVVFAFCIVVFVLWIVVFVFCIVVFVFCIVVFVFCIVVFAFCIVVFVLWIVVVLLYIVFFLPRSSSTRKFLLFLARFVIFVPKSSSVRTSQISSVRGTFCYVCALYCFLCT